MNWNFGELQEIIEQFKGFIYICYQKAHRGIYFSIENFDAGKYTLLERVASSGRFPQIVSRGEMRILSDHEG
jgi:hypothetical protein